MHALPPSIVAGARELLAAGWLPARDQPGLVHAPLGAQPAAAHWVPDWTWQAMTLMQLAADPTKEQKP